MEEDDILSHIHTQSVVYVHQQWGADLSESIHLLHTGMGRGDVYRTQGQPRREYRALSARSVPIHDGYGNVSAYRLSDYVSMDT